MDNDKKLIPISAVPSVLAELTGVQKCRGTIYLWISRGCRTTDARIVKLETIRKLKHLYTTREMVMKFVKEVG